jgi:uncharacterized membrane protein (DUF441 family)
LSLCIDSGLLGSSNSLLFSLGILFDSLNQLILFLFLLFLFFEQKLLGLGLLIVVISFLIEIISNEAKRTTQISPLLTDFGVLLSSELPSRPEISYIASTFLNIPVS